MSTGATSSLVGQPLNLVDGRLKVTGTASYPSDITLPGMTHAALVQSTVASGRIAIIATSVVERAPGVLAIFTHANTPRLARGPITPIWCVAIAAVPERRRFLLRSTRGDGSR